MTEPVEATAAPRSRLPLILALGAAAILVLLLVTVLGGGDDDSEDVADTSPGTTAPTTTTTTAPDAGGAGGPAGVAAEAGVPETFEVHGLKNPFQPLRVIGGGGGAATGTSTGTGSSTGTGTSTGGTGSTSGGTSTGTGTSTSGGTSTGGSGTVEPRRSDRVALLDVFAEGGAVVANVRVNDTVHKVSEDETFAGSYRVLSLSQADDCGRFMFGDDTFRLCRGEETLK